MVMASPLLLVLPSAFPTDADVPGVHYVPAVLEFLLLLESLCAGIPALAGIPAIAFISALAGVPALDGVPTVTESLLFLKSPLLTAFWRSGVPAVSSVRCCCHHVVAVWLPCC
jgi:hypothetical protein